MDRNRLIVLNLMRRMTEFMARLKAISEENKRAHKEQLNKCR